MIKLLLFLIYGISFYSLGNTLYRIDSTGNYNFSIIPLFTEGFIGPIRSLYYLFIYNGLFDGLNFLWHIMTRPYYPYSMITYYFTIKFTIKLIKKYFV